MRYQSKPISVVDISLACFTTHRPWLGSSSLISVAAGSVNCLFGLWSCKYNTTHLKYDCMLAGGVEVEFILCGQLD